VRKSKQRDLVLEIVLRSKEHPTAEDVFSEARKTLPRISLGTVYRNLRLLTDEGQIRSIRFGSEPERFDGFLDVHEHFICKVCGKIYDIEPTLQIPNLPGKLVTDYRLDLIGFCESCSKTHV
jgi:Fe2+ or Zn2+ uptake regulation protein